METTEIQLEQFVLDFMKAVRVSCNHAAAVPVAFAILFAEPGPSETTLFKVDMNCVKDILPKGEDEVQRFLCEALDKWIKENYPDSKKFNDVCTSTLIH